MPKVSQDRLDFLANEIDHAIRHWIWQKVTLHIGASRYDDVEHPPYHEATPRDTLGYEEG